MFTRVVKALAVLVLLSFGVWPAKADVGFSLNFGTPGFGLSFGDNGQGEVPFFYEEQPNYYYYPRYFPPCNCIVMVHPEFGNGDWVWYDQYGNALYYGSWDPPERGYYNNFRIPYRFYAYHNRDWGDYHRPWNCRGNCGNDRHDWNDWRRRGHNDDDNQRQYWDRNDNGYRQWSNQRHDDFRPQGADRHPDWRQHNQWRKNNQDGNGQGNNWQNNGTPQGQQPFIPKKKDNKPNNWQQNNGGGQGGNNWQGNNRGKPQGQQPPPQGDNGCSAKAHAKGKC